jgi:hypothetical protein
VAAGDITDPDLAGYSFSSPDWGRIILSNLPAAVVLLIGAVAFDASTDYDLAKIALRYGGPGAPPTSVLSFWTSVILGMGSLVSVITALVIPESFSLVGNCPECGEPNKGGFGDVFGITGGQKLARTRCTNCMADLEFELDSRKVRVTRTSEVNKSAALERGRLNALEAAKREARSVMEDDERYRRR